MDIVDRIFLIQNGKIGVEYKREEFLKLSLQELNHLGLRDKEKTKLKIPKFKGRGALEVRSLEFKFTDSNKKLSIENLNFQKGKIYGFVGANGLGKSTFLRCLIGVEKSSRDEICLDGKKLSKKDRLKISSLVMQDVGHQLFTDAVINEARLGIKNVDDNNLEDILKKLDLQELRNRHPMSLSGGQKQRVAIASVLCKNSKLIFFDEPTSGMDYANMKRISSLIRECINCDKIIFIVSHDIEFLNLTADYVVCLK